MKKYNQKKKVMSRPTIFETQQKKKDTSKASSYRIPLIQNDEKYSRCKNCEE